MLQKEDVHVQQWGMKHRRYGVCSIVFTVGPVITHTPSVERKCMGYEWVWVFTGMGLAGERGFGGPQQVWVITGMGYHRFDCSSGGRGVGIRGI